MADLSLPVFNTPKGFKNIFEMSAREMSEYLGISKAASEKLLDSIFLSMHQNNVAIERDEILKEKLSPDEWETYSETGYFYWDGIKYNSEGKPA